MRLANGIGTVYKLSGNRRNPYIVRKTTGWDIDEESGKAKQKYITIGYAPTRAKGLEMLMDYNKHPFDVESSKITFAEIFGKWSAEKFPTISDSNVKGYNASYNCCSAIHDRVFKDLKLTDLQGVIDTCSKNYPTLRKLKVLLSQIAMKYEFCNKDYSQYVDILKYKNRNHNRTDRSPFSNTENGIRIVPIADKTYPFFKKWYNDGCEYLLHTPEGAHFDYRNYYDSYWTPVMELIGCSHKPHDTRHTCISMLTEKEVSPTMIKKIVGHSGAMSLTERVYTHVNVQELLRAINRI